MSCRGELNLEHFDFQEKEKKLNEGAGDVVQLINA